MKRLRKRAKMAVLHVNTINPSKGGVTGRICRFVSQTLGIPLIHDVQSADMFMDDYDVLFVFHGVLVFSKHRQQCMELNERAADAVWMNNDHAQTFDKRMRRDGRPYRVWTTVEKTVRPSTEDRWINWNRLTWVPDVWSDEYTRPGLMYYGSYRPDRLDDFENYFPGQDYPLHIVGYHQHLKQFHKLAPQAHQWAAFKDQRQLRAFQSTLYLQDRHNDQHYGCPANRFYEMLYTGIPMVFDHRCTSTFGRASETEGIEYDITPYMVDSPAGIPALVKRSVAIGQEQRALWYTDYRAMLERDFTELCRKAGFIH